jgi:hypothetical protein
MATSGAINAKNGKHPCKHQGGDRSAEAEYSKERKKHEHAKASHYNDAYAIEQSHSFHSQRKCTFAVASLNGYRQ